MSAKNEQVIPLLLPIEKNSESQKNTILTNLIKMLTERNLLDRTKQEQHIKKLISTQADDQIYRVPLDYGEKYYGKGATFMAVRLINQRITSLSKSSGVSDFLNVYKSQPKIIVVAGINPKIQYMVRADTVTYPNTEIFLERELLINIIDHVSQPKFSLLTEEEKKNVLDSYHGKQREMPKMLINDPISQYYNAKQGQLFRIIRPSETSGESVTYRLVIKGQMKET
ncbi:MAG: DNA-directed RNA polymerase subunit 5 [Harvfovirus sp.]|uniref:DNA-directed RNA polymerase subunit 5 n=1 Tax=Harvfovirus sp. TaxID=2487768 RepID=A0A3G5A6R8_9VIRU|nr:MAG: DNA-directed RNA polymerase subunit 5 [Harvfovirus sp.]